MTTPTPPPGVSAMRPFSADHGEVARWRIEGPGPWLELSLSVGHDGSGFTPRVVVPPHVRISVFPGPIDTPDPVELDCIADAFHAAAEWIRREQTPVADDPTLFDEAVAGG
jgi:hypothetical protein